MKLDKKYWELMKRVSGNIKAIRERRDLTQEDMDEKGFGPRWYQRLESGKYSISLPTLDRLARTFKCDVRDFFE
jgi:transcriptional regulator with XRE-family HTH domain